MHYQPVSGVITFLAGETQKEIYIQILDSGTAEELDEIFQVQLHSPNGGAKISKKKVVMIELTGDSREV